MAKRYLLGLDNGTTGVKCKVYDLEGNIMGEGYREYACVYPKPGWTEQDISMLMEANYEALGDVLKKSGVDPSEVAGMGLSTQRALHFYIDKDGKILRDGLGISWQDGRHTKQMQWIRDVVGEDRYFEITGLPVGQIWSAGKIKWVMENEPEVFEQADKVLLTQEYFLHELGAKDGWFQDWSNGSLYGLMDIRNMEWSQELCKDWGMPMDKLPQLVGSGWKVGGIDEYTHERTGLTVGMPICTGGGDQQCAAIGAGVIEEGLCEVTFGTAGVSVAHLNSPKYDPTKAVSLSAHAFPEKTWEAEGIQAAAGSNLRWFRDEVGHLIKLIEPFTKQDPYVILNEHARQVPAGSNGVFYHPYLSGSVAPHYDELARGGFFGLSFKANFGCLARAVMEGVAFEARDIVEAFQAFVPQREIILSGGATKSPLWCQIQADIYGSPTTFMQEGECTVIGAAILGGVGAGVFKSVKEGCDVMLHKVREFEPDPRTHEVYNELYQVWKDAYKALADAGVYKELNKFQLEHA
ncbi:MAG: FGGY family carbohydrate kinase [Candidatus Dormibacteria bacterium]|jgi:xylulokinase